MSYTFVVEPLPQPDNGPVKSRPGARLAARFQALMESLVAASARSFEGSEPSFYRFPPI